MMKAKKVADSRMGKRASQTRKSIKKFFPMGALMSRGKSNPISLHSVDDDLFRCLWSFLAELMIVTDPSGLARSTKEAIAELVSSKNECPLCTVGHRLMGIAARQGESSKHGSDRALADARHEQAMGLAGKLIDMTLDSREDELDLSLHELRQQDGILNDTAKTEVGLVVFLYSHLNRVITSCLGEQMSSVLQANVSVANSTAGHPFTAKGVLSQVMTTILKPGMKGIHKPGITKSLFPESVSVLELPEHLASATLAGEDRAAALGRLVAWVECHEKKFLADGTLSKDVLQVVEDPFHALPSHMTPNKVAQWAVTGVRQAVQHLPDETSQATAATLLLVEFSPHSVYHHYQWKALAGSMGDDKAKKLLIWWSLRCSLRQAKGLGDSTQKAGW